MYDLKLMREVLDISLKHYGFEAWTEVSLDTRLEIQFDNTSRASK